MTKLLFAIACSGCFFAGPGKNEVKAKGGRESWKAKITSATFDGNVVKLELGPRVSITIASCYAHAQQKVGDHDHVAIELDHKPATEGALDITDCTTTHVIAKLWAKFGDGTSLEASIDTDLSK